MPEAFAVLLVFFVSLGVYVFAWMRTRDPANQKPSEEVERLQMQRAWLEERLQLADGEGWGAEMRASLRDQLAENARELTKARSADSPPAA